MKKRSLVAAIAMLVVSAIVLTSATYAWFTATSSAKVEAISATVTNDGGKLLLTPEENAASNDPQPATVLYAADFNVARTLNPVSMSINAPVAPATTTSPLFTKVTYNGTGYSDIHFSTDDMTSLTAQQKASYPVVNTDYIYYGFDASYANDEATAKTINIKPTFTQNSSNFTYALVKVTVGSTESWYLFDESGEYSPVIDLPAKSYPLDAETKLYSILDDNTSNKAYIAQGDTGYSASYLGGYTGATLWSTVTAASDGFKYIPFTAAASTTTTADIEVYIWAEGQDPQCTGNISGQSTAMTFDFSVASAS